MLIIAFFEYYTFRFSTLSERGVSNDYDLVNNVSYVFVYLFPFFTQYY